MERIDDAVRRILRLKHRVGLFEQPNTFAKDYPNSVVRSLQHTAGRRIGIHRFIEERLCRQPKSLIAHKARHPTAGMWT